MSRSAGALQAPAPPGSQYGDCPNELVASAGDIDDEPISVSTVEKFGEFAKDNGKKMKM
jgi:hypothetical protein